jgi:NADPH-dependent 2,4-dienoyl-CoA reductase/sulfur reductase-like enzyme
MSEAVRAELEANDVALHLGVPAQSVEASGDELVVHGENVSFRGEVVLVAIGVRPRSQLAKEAGLELSVGGSIAVDGDLRTSDPDIYAAGDCADAYHVVTGKKAWVPLALRANRAGWAVADIVSGKRETVGLPGIAGTAVFKVFELEVARTGLTESEARAAGFDPAAAMIKAGSRAHAYPGASPLWVALTGDKTTGRLLGAQMVGREGAAHRINALAVALGAKMTVEEFAQTDTAYAPPFSPTWDPMIIAANQLLKKLG